MERFREDIGDVRDGIEAYLNLDRTVRIDGQGEFINLSLRQARDLFNWLARVLPVVESIPPEGKPC